MLLLKILTSVQKVANQLHNTSMQSSHTGSLHLVNRCWKPPLLHNVHVIQASGKQEVAKAENFLYEPYYWPASALWAQ